MKYFKKKGLALFLALSMCLGLLNLSAFAADGDGHQHNEDGWTCTWTDPVTAPDCQHEHDEDCYIPGEPVLVCDQDHEHTDDCYIPGEDVLACQHVCGEECVTVVSEGYWTCVAPEAEEEVEETPAEVQAFLDAVDAIEVPEEDLLLSENAGLAETLSNSVWYAYSLWEALTEEEQELEAVDISFQELQNMLMVLPDYAASTYALSSVTVNPDYQTSVCYPGATKFGGSITKSVGESGYYLRRAVNNFYCTHCGYFFGQSTAKEYANIQWEQSVDGVISDVSFKAGTLEGYPCLEMDFTGANAGTTLVTIQYDVNFHTRWNSSYAACPSCRTMTYVDQYDDNWYHYVDTFYVTVTDQETVNGYERWVYIPTNAQDEDDVGEIDISWLKSGYYKKLLFQEINDPNGIIDSCVDVTTTYNSSDQTIIRVLFEGLEDATPGSEPIPIYVTYKVAQYNSWDAITGWTTYTDKINVVVYDPETIVLPANSGSITYNYGYTTNANCTYSSACKPTASTNGNVLQATGNVSAKTYIVQSNSIAGTADVRSIIEYFSDKNARGGLANTIVEYVQRTHFVVETNNVEESTTPVTIVKEFDGLTEDQIPDNFALAYTISGCSEHNDLGALKKADARVTNSDGVVKLAWDVELPAAHGSSTHTITFSESNATVSGYNTPTFSGNVVTLESLVVEDGAKAAVITLTNRYEPDGNVYVLSYDGMGGVNCPATQVEEMGNSISHTFQVKGAESVMKVPTNEGYTFLGWAETERATVPVFSYDSTTNTYSPAEITLTKDAPSKTLYAVWEKTPPTAPEAPTKNEAAEILKDKYTVTVECTNNDREHTLITKDYALTADVFSSIGEPYLENGEWKCEVNFVNNTFVEKFNTENGVKCTHDSVGGGVGLTLTWNADESIWEYTGPNRSKTISTQCHPETKPEAPTPEDVNNLMPDPNSAHTSSSVRVICWPDVHQTSYFDCYKTTNRLVIGEVEGNAENGYTCEVTFPGQVYVDAYNAMNSARGIHTWVDKNGNPATAAANNVTVTLEWKDDAWALPSSFTDPVTFYAKCPPKLTVTKSNNGFQTVDQDSGKAAVHFTVTVKNESGYDLYGLAIIDTLETTVTSNNVPVSNGYTLSIENVKYELNEKIHKAGMTDPSANNGTTESVVDVLPRSERFSNGKTVTLEYDVVVTNTGSDALQVDLDNTVVGGSWTTPPVSASRMAKMTARSYDATNSASSGTSTGIPGSGSTGSTGTGGSTTIQDYDFNVTGQGSSNASTSVGGSGGSSSAGGTLEPAKNTLTYSWSGLPNNAGVQLPAGGSFTTGTTVTVDTNYNSGSTVTVGETAYTFSGWTTTTPEVEVVDGQFQMPYGGVTISGTWTPKPDEEKTIPVTPCVMFEVVGEDAEQLTKEQISENYTLTLTYIDQNGEQVKTFKGSEADWTVDSSKGYPVATWPSFDVKVLNKTGEYVMISVAQSDYEIGNNDSFVYSGTYTPDGSTKPDGTGAIKVSRISSGLTATTKNSYKWTSIGGSETEYTVTFDSDGGSVVEPQTVQAGGTATRPADPTRDGYTFVAWYLNGTAYDFASPVTENITLIAQWTRNESGKTEYTVTVTYQDEDGNAIAGYPDVTVSTTDGGKYDVTEQKVDIDGYTFDSAASDALTGTVTEDTTITLVYKTNSKDTEETPDPEQYTVTFDSAGGSAVDSQTVQAGGTATRPADPIRGGYTFVGWYLNGTAYDFASPVTENITLIAQWTPNGGGGGGGSSSRPTPPTTEPDDPATEIPDEDPPLAELPEVPEEDIKDEDPPLAELPEVPEEDIKDEDPPLADIPEEDILEEEIPEDEVPLAGVPEEDIPDEEVPLASVPQTGDNTHTGLWCTLMALSALGLAALGLLKKREEQE